MTVKALCYLDSTPRPLPAGKLALGANLYPAEDKSFTVNNLKSESSSHLNQGGGR